MRWHDANTTHPKLGEAVLCELPNKEVIVGHLKPQGDSAGGTIGLAWKPVHPLGNPEFRLSVLRRARISLKDEPEVETSVPASTKTLMAR